MINLFRYLIPDSAKRALTLKVLRWFAGIASGAVTTFLAVHMNFSTADAAQTGAAVSALVIAASPGIASAVCSWLDFKSVGTQVASAGTNAIADVAANPNVVSQLAAAQTPDAIAQTLQNYASQRRALGK